mmetsp:Transcript_47921/g.108762  ORF Transcript_47921/g.108762 Transcript_47921/m.108762 type:complete len:238 (+) Transcript_47921:380-1093(+)
MTSMLAIEKIFMTVSKPSGKRIPQLNETVAEICAKLMRHLNFILPLRRTTFAQAMNAVIFSAAAPWSPGLKRTKSAPPKKMMMKKKRPRPEPPRLPRRRAPPVSRAHRGPLSGPSAPTRAPLAGARPRCPCRSWLRKLRRGSEVKARAAPRRAGGPRRCAGRGVTPKRRRGGWCTLRRSSPASGKTRSGGRRVSGRCASRPCRVAHTLSSSVSWVLPAPGHSSPSPSRAPSRAPTSL